MAVNYDNGKVSEIRDYIAKIYTDSSGSKSDLEIKEKSEREAYVADSIAGKLKPASFDNQKNKMWQKYLEKNLRVPERVMNVLGRGNYTAIVCFVVNKFGNTDDIYMMHSIEWSADAEMFHLIKDSPPWQAAIRNGEKVSYRQKQSITFSVN
jgi:hypothetical protein